MGSINLPLLAEASVKDSAKVTPKFLKEFERVATELVLAYLWRGEAHRLAGETRAAELLAQMEYDVRVSVLTATPPNTATLLQKQLAQISYLIQLAEFVFTDFKKPPDPSLVTSAAGEIINTLEAALWSKLAYYSAIDTEMKTFLFLHSRDVSREKRMGKSRANASPQQQQLESGSSIDDPAAFLTLPKSYPTNIKNFNREQREHYTRLKRRANEITSDDGNSNTFTKSYFREKIRTYLKQVYAAIILTNEKEDPEMVEPINLGLTGLFTAPPEFQKYLERAQSQLYVEFVGSPEKHSGDSPTIETSDEEILVADFDDLPDSNAIILEKPSSTSNSHDIQAIMKFQQDSPHSPPPQQYQQHQQPQKPKRRSLLDRSPNAERVYFPDSPEKKLSSFSFKDKISKKSRHRITAAVAKNAALPVSNKRENRFVSPKPSRQNERSADKTSNHEVIYVLDSDEEEVDIEDEGEYVEEGEKGEKDDEGEDEDEEEEEEEEEYEEEKAQVTSKSESDKGEAEDDEDGDDEIDVKFNNRRRSVGRKERTVWSQHELNALQDGMLTHNTSWAKIKGMHSDALQHRDQVSLKDKARNELIRRILNGEDTGVFSIVHSARVQATVDKALARQTAKR
ncbi:hypothetical protein BDR26DRAFT_857119 [Obelidium mucronatum]|nr:hypothetical protein BDR26DRAFT_857119 [Obelidium mucronatum]